MDELRNEFIEWSDFNDTHLNRLSLISRRLALVTKELSELWKLCHTFPKSEMERVQRVHSEMSNIFLDISEVCTSIADDTLKFNKVLDLLEEELGKLPDVGNDL